MHRLLVFTLVVFTTSAPLAAQTSNATLSADLGTIARLSFSSTTLSFDEADPDVLAQVPASGGPVTITAKARRCGSAGAAGSRRSVSCPGRALPQRQAASGAAATPQKLRGEEFRVINEPPTQ